MPRVTFLHSEGRSGEVEENISLLDAAKELGFRLNHDCGGNASARPAEWRSRWGMSISRRSISTSKTYWIEKH